MVYIHIGSYGNFISGNNSESVNPCVKISENVTEGTYSACLESVHVFQCNTSVVTMEVEL